MRSTLVLQFASKIFLPGEEMQYKIVGSTEADILGGKISNESPVGVALIGAKAGQTVDVETPKGTVLQYEILEIQK